MNPSKPMNLPQVLKWARKHQVIYQGNTGEVHWFLDHSPVSFGREGNFSVTAPLCRASLEACLANHRETQRKL